MTLSIKPNAPARRILRSLQYLGYQPYGFDPADPKPWILNKPESFPSVGGGYHLVIPFGRKSVVKLRALGRTRILDIQDTAGKLNLSVIQQEPEPSEVLVRFDPLEKGIFNMKMKLKHFGVMVFDYLGIPVLVT